MMVMRYCPERYSSQIRLRLLRACRDRGVWPATYKRRSYLGSPAALARFLVFADLACFMIYGHGRWAAIFSLSYPASLGSGGSHHVQPLMLSPAPRHSRSRLSGHSAVLVFPPGARRFSPRVSG